MIDILIVDDSKSVRARLEYLVDSITDFKVVGIAQNGVEAISYANTLQPDVILLDMEMPRINGFTAIKLISAKSPQSKILVFSSHDRPKYVIKSMSAGATGYLLKSASDEEIERVIRYVLKGHIYVEAGLFTKMLPMVQSKEINISELKSGLTRVNDEETVSNINSRNSLAVADRPNSDTIELKHEPNIGKKQVLGWLILTVGLATGIYGMRQWSKKLPALSRAEQSATLADTKFIGKLESAKTIDIAVTNPGVVENIEVRLGERVEVGQPLLTLKNLTAEDRQTQIIQEKQKTRQQRQTARQRVLELEQQIDRLKSNLVPLQAEIAEADELFLLQSQDTVSRTKAIYQRARERFNRLERLYDQEVISQEQLEQALAEVDIAKVDYDMAIAVSAAKNQSERSERQLSQLQKKLKLQELQDAISNFTKQKQTANLEYRQATDKLALLDRQARQINESQVLGVRQVVRATEAGIIVELPVAVGDRIYEGSSVVELGKLEQIKVAVDVDSRIVNALDKQQKATVQIGKEATVQKFAGKIANISPIPNEKLNYLVEVKFSNPSDSLIIGQTAYVQFLPRTSGE